MQFFLVLYFSYNFEGRILCVNDFKKINLDLISEHVHGTMPLILSILFISYLLLCLYSIHSSVRSSAVKDNTGISSLSITPNLGVALIL